MLVTGQAQPDAMPLLKFAMEGVDCNEAGAFVLGPTNVIAAGNTFTLKTELSFDGGLVPLLVGPPGAQFNVFHHVQNIETGASFALPQSPAPIGFTVGVNSPGATAQNPRHITVISGPYTTGGPGSGANLTIPAGSAAGTFRITTHVHAVASGIRPIVAAFADGLTIEIV
ncbi:MAG: hypothetical protein AAB217_10710 [Chloroflexota bacterium]